MFTKANLILLCGLMMIHSSLAQGKKQVPHKLKQQREKLLLDIKQHYSLSNEQFNKLSQYILNAPFISQGNPEITQHPMTEQECTTRLQKVTFSYDPKQFEKICGAKHMAPIYDLKTQKPEEAKFCIDQFEFPNIPCRYPVVWVKAKEAAEICQLVGKRLCDAHEWEQGCSGELYDEMEFIKQLKGDDRQRIRQQRKLHNDFFRNRKRWAYGSQRKKGICAMASFKSKNCNGGSWKDCGSNTYPTGAFPECRSPYYVFDQHGNAAEHMNLAVRKEQLASQNSSTLGYTEMKGSWFIFDHYQAHPDWCQWRAPFWHGTRVMSNHSHHNYHLGFRCCKTR